ncbi:MAG: hypothetical protein KIS67_11485 [Verrucomicrobiae bacterium]|nr:hypothetical protein [Verrucomicrobiae bacterium]
MKKLLMFGLLAVVILAVVVVAAVGFFLDSAVKKGVETIGPQLTKVSVKLDKVGLSLLSGSGKVNGLVVGNPEGYKTPNAINIGHASLAVSPGSLLSDKVIVKSIRVAAAEVTFEGGLSGNNLSQILDNVNAATGGDAPATGTPAEAKPGKKLQVDDFIMTGAKVNVSLTGMGGQSVTVPLPDIHLTGLGQGSEGITSAELTKVVLNEVIAVTTKVATSDKVKELTKGVTDAATKVAGDAVDKATKSVTDLFKKKP